MVNYFKNVGTKFTQSSRMLSKPMNLCISAMLLALAVILRVFENNGMLVLSTNLIKIGVSTFPVVIAAILYGPVSAGIVGGLTDVLGYVIAPVGGAYIPCFTINMILIGMIYGIALFGEKISIPRLIAAELVVTIFVNIALGVTWFVLFYGMDFKTAFTVRAVKGFVSMPIITAVNFALYKVIAKIPEVKKILKSSKASA